MHNTKKNKEINTPSIKNNKDIENIEKAASIANDAVDYAISISLPGVRADTIDKKVEEYILSLGAYPANLEVDGYNYSTSISTANEIAHGLPSKKKLLKYSEPVCIDIGVKYNGYYADHAKTFIVGENKDIKESINKTASDMINICKHSLINSIKILKPSGLLSSYGRTVHTLVKNSGYTVIKFLTGHGVGYKYHETPYIYNFYHPENDIILKEGMVLAFELMITNGADRYKQSKDGWTLYTADGSLAVHFEYTVVIKKDSIEILGGLI